MSRQGSVPSSSFGIALDKAASTSVQRDIPTRHLRAEVLAVYDSRTIAEAPLSEEDKNQIAERLNIKLSAVTSDLLSKSSWAKVKVYEHAASRMVPVELSSKEMAEHGNGANIASLTEGELDALIKFQGKGNQNGTLVKLISKNSKLAVNDKASEQSQSGFIDLMGSTRVYDIAGI